MLWLAGLMGIVSVGATSFALYQPEPETDDVEAEDDPLDETEMSDQHGDFFDFIQDMRDSTDEGGAHALAPAQSGASEPVSSPDRFDDYDVLALDESPEATPDAFGAKLLQDIVEDPQANDIASSEGFADPVDDTMEANEAAPILMGDWVSQGQPSEVFDYDSHKDSLMLVWDDMTEGAEEPEVRVEQDPFDNEVMHVIMNDTSVAEVYGDPDLSTADITVIPLSSALIVGLEPA